VRPVRGSRFAALAPDLYDGKVAGTVAEAKKLRAKVTASRKEPAYKYLIRMIGELRREAGADDIAVWVSPWEALGLLAHPTFGSRNCCDGDFLRCA